MKVLDKDFVIIVSDIIVGNIVSYLRLYNVVVLLVFFKKDYMVFLECFEFYGFLNMKCIVLKLYWGREVRVERK